MGRPRPGADAAGVARSFKATVLIGRSGPKKVSVFKKKKAQAVPPDEGTSPDDARGPIDGSKGRIRHGTQEGSGLLRATAATRTPQRLGVKRFGGQLVTAARSRPAAGNEFFPGRTSGAARTTRSSRRCRASFASGPRRAGRDISIEPSTSSATPPLAVRRFQPG
jgi:hypothetical protein